MKKIYQTPEIEVTIVDVQLMIATSPGGHDEIGGGEELVKEERTDMGRGSDSYNVWNEDWRK